MNAPDPAPTADRGDPPLDRTISPISGRLSAGPGGRALGFAGLLAGCAVLAFATWSADRPRPERPPERPARQVVAYEPGPSTALVPAATSAPPPDPMAPVVPAIDPAFDGTAPGAARAAAPPRPQAAPLIAWSRSARLQPPAVPGPDLTGSPAGGTEPDGLERLSRTSTIPRVPARNLGERTLLLLAGTTLPCILQTALDSSTPGHVACVLPVDVWSDNGTVVVLEKGTRVMGEHRGGLRQGQRRIFVVWTRAVTPSGVAVDLASPATDALGRGGFDGAVDTRFWDRFGAALLLSVVGDAGDALRDGGRRSGRLPSEAASIAVDGGADIPPVLRKAQGSEVAIFTARDFDFSSVYRLRRRGP